MQINFNEDRNVFSLLVWFLRNVYIVRGNGKVKWKIRLTVDVLRIELTYLTDIFAQYGLHDVELDIRVTSIEMHLCS